MDSSVAVVDRQIAVADTPVVVVDTRVVVADTRVAVDNPVALVDTRVVVGSPRVAVPVVAEPVVAVRFAAVPVVAVPAGIGSKVVVPDTRPVAGIVVGATGILARPDVPGLFGAEVALAGGLIGRPVRGSARPAGQNFPLAVARTDRLRLVADSSPGSPDWLG